MSVLLNEEGEPWFPHPAFAPPSGYLAAGGDLTPQRLVLAYSNGIFPWEATGDPRLWRWFSPDPRFLLFPDEFKPTRYLKAALRKGTFEVRIDTDYEAVMRACSEVERPKEMGGTWIEEDMIEAYCQMHGLGLAHSFGTYRDGKLVGGLYGISLGAAFFGESMFHQEPEASRVALAALVDFAKARGFHFIDCQQETPHMARLGGRPVPRKEFLERLQQSMEVPTQQATWENDSQA